MLTLQVDRGVRRRLAEQYEGRVSALAELIDESFRSEGEQLGRGLAALAEAMRADSRLRRALAGGDPAEREYQLGYASAAMALMGLDALQIQDGTGRILSSGHYRNTFDRVDPALPGGLARQRGAGALAWIRGDEGPFFALARVESVLIAGERFVLVGGSKVDGPMLGRLAGGSGLAVALRHGPGQAGFFATEPALAALLAGEGSEADHIVRISDLRLPLVGAPSGWDRAELIVAYPRAPLLELQRGLRIWLALTVFATLIGALALAFWLSARISRPLRELAAKTLAVRDIEHVDVDWGSGRTDEVGALGRFMGEMVARLAASTRRLRDAERRATLGEMARQVTHDIRNGFTPLRNVIRHLSEVAGSEPEKLPRIYAERLGTLEAGLDYLESLAGHYARMSPRARPTRCDLAEALADLLPAGAEGGGVSYLLELDPQLPPVEADPVNLRRVVENLLRNAEESLPPGGGVITLRGRADRDPRGEAVLILEIEDTGAGIGPELLDRVFDDFYTSKESGGGLGLSIVRRLVADLGGSVQVRSEPGVGSCFTIHLPAGPPAGANPEEGES